MQLQQSAQIQRLVKESVGEKLTDEDAMKMIEETDVNNAQKPPELCIMPEERVQNRTAERVVDVQVPQIQ